jgi:Bacterial Ig-like domain (group 2)
MKKLIQLAGVALLTLQLCALSCTAQTTTVINLPANPVTAAILQPATIVAGATNAFGTSNSPLSQLQDGTANVPLPYDCTRPSNSCYWLTSNPAVATISQVGLATGVSAGTATITYTSLVAGYAVTGSALLTVSAAPLIQIPTCATPPCALPPGTNGVAYSFTAVATGGTLPYTWSVSSGSFSACGVSLNASTGVISGTATTGSCTATLTVTDNSGGGDPPASIAVTLSITSTSMCGPPNYSCSSNSTAVIQTPAPPFNTSSSNGTTCVAGTSNGTGNGLLNSIGYDTSINPSGVDPYVRVSDCTQLSGQSVQATPTGGDNDEASNCAERTDTSTDCASATLHYILGIYGGVPFVEGIQKNGSGIYQVVAPFPSSSGSSQIPPPRGASAFSNQNHLILFMEAANSTCSGCSGDPTIYQLTLDGGTGHTPTTSESVLYDVGANCSPLPNGITFGQAYSGGFSHDYLDNKFTFDVSSVQILNLGVDTISVTNGSTAFTISGPSLLPPNGADAYATAKVNGVSYIIASGNTTTTGNFTTPYTGSTGSGVSVQIVGGQGSGIYQIEVQLSPAGCAVKNLYTGTSVGSGALASTATGTLDSGCVGMHIHDSFMVRDGSYTQVSGASTGTGCGTQSIFPQFGTLHEVVCSGTVAGSGLNLCVGGHDAFGWHNIVITQNPAFVSFPPQNANSATPFAVFGNIPISGATANCQNHFSWRNATSGDTQPIIFGSDNNNYSTSGTTSTYGYPTMNEIGALFSNGTIRRFGHNFILGPGNGSGCGTANVGPFDNLANLFQGADGIGYEDQSGHFWIQTTSFLGQFGKDAKGYTRTDLVLVQQQ